jgi:hypothetical protein
MKKGVFIRIKYKAALMVVDIIRNYYNNNQFSFKNEFHQHKLNNMNDNTHAAVYMDPDLRTFIVLVKGDREYFLTHMDSYLSYDLIEFPTNVKHKIIRIIKHING